MPIPSVQNKQKRNKQIYMETPLFLIQNKGISRREQTSNDSTKDITVCIGTAGTVTLQVPQHKGDSRRVIRMRRIEVIQGQLHAAPADTTVP